MKALFRGFCRNENGKETIYLNGEEVKGYWVQGYYQNLCGFHEIVTENKEKSFSIITYQVIHETVSEAVRGFIDLYGKQVFIGDIVKNIHSGTVGEVIYTYEFAYKIKKQDGYDIWIGANDYYTWEVIGTKWDKGEQKWN